MYVTDSSTVHTHMKGAGRVNQLVIADEHASAFAQGCRPVAGINKPP